MIDHKHFASALRSKFPNADSQDIRGAVSFIKKIEEIVPGLKLTAYAVAIGRDMKLRLKYNAGKSRVTYQIEKYDIDNAAYYTLHDILHKYLNNIVYDSFAIGYFIDHHDTFKPQFDKIMNSVDFEAAKKKVDENNKRFDALKKPGVIRLKERLFEHFVQYGPLTEEEVREAWCLAQVELVQNS